MTSDRWQQIKDLFLETLDQAPEQQKSFLDAACAGDEELRQRVEALLEGQRSAPSILEQNAAEVLSLDTNKGEPLLDTHIGPYRLERLLGRGGMGSVYLAQRDDGQFQQTVAVKVVRRGLDTDDILSRFRYERQILAALEHPHIAALYDGGMTDDQRPYFVMEYVEGEPITVYCDHKRLSTNQRLALFRTVCRAVQHAHQNLIIHRDLKPSNILVTDDGTVKLLDFGIAKLVAEEDPADGATVPHTRTGLRLMTPEYAAPEQVRGEAVTTATDSYQLGVLLYELLTGQRPYQIARRVQQEIERVILEEEPTRPSTALSKADTGATVSEARSTTQDRLRRRLSGDLDTIVLKALAKEPDRRYSTVEQLAEDIRRHLNGLPVLARPDAIGYRVRKFVQRHRFGVATAAVVVLALLAGMAGTLWQAQVAATERDRAQAEASKATKTADFLVNLFQAASPNEAQGREITARELLETGETSLAQELAEQPGVHSQMLLVMGRVYNEMGQYERAIGLMEEALAIRQEQDAPPAEVAEAYHFLANSHRNNSDYATAETVIENALRLQQAASGSRHADVAASIALLAEVKWGLGAYQEADSLYQIALTMQQELLGEESYPALVTMNDYAILLEELGRFDEARAYYVLGLRLGIEQTGPNHPDVLYTSYNIAHLDHMQGNPSAADSTYRSLLPQARQILGADHPNVAFMLNAYASLVHDLGRYAEAEQIYQEAIAIYGQHYGETHPHYLSVLNNLAFVYVEQEDYDKAQDVFAKVLRARRAKWPDGHANLALSLHNMGSVLHHKGDLVSAETHLREALDMFTTAYGREHHRTARTLLLLGQCLTSQQKYAEAEPLMTDALEVFKTVYGLDNEETQQALKQIMTLYETWGHPEKAAPYQAQRTA